MDAADHGLAVLCPVPEAFRIDVVGSDAVAVLHNLTTNDVRHLEVGGGCETFFTNVRGQVLVHGIAVRLQDRMSVVGLHPDPTAVAEHIDRYIIREDAQVLDRSEETITLLLAGKGLMEMLRSVAEAVGAPGPVSDQGTPAGIGPLPASPDLVPVRLPWRRPMIWINAGADLAGAVQQAVQSTDAHRLTRAEFEALRIESRWPKPGAEIGDKTLPQELDRDSQAISFTKGCYLGQETVARLDARGQVQKKLCLLRLPAGTSARGSDPVLSGAQEVGRLTSVAGHPDGTQVALAYLKRGFFEGQQPLCVGGTPAEYVSHR